MKKVKTDPKGVLTGTHYLDGDYAIAEGGLAAGCRFFGALLFSLGIGLAIFRAGIRIFLFFFLHDPIHVLFPSFVLMEL